MGFRYYYADRIREKMPGFRGTDEELQSAIDDISLLYNSAIKELETRLDILSDDFDKKHSYMPIHHVQSRLKTFESIIEKATRYGIDDPLNNLDTVRREILDIAIVRYNLSLNAFQKYIATTVATDVSEKTVAEIMENADKLQGDDRDVLKLRPGITGPATLKYRLEDEMISEYVAQKQAAGDTRPMQKIAVEYNDTVI